MRNTYSKPSPVGFHATTSRPARRPADGRSAPKIGERGRRCRTAFRNASGFNCNSAAAGRSASATRCLPRLSAARRRSGDSRRSGNALAHCRPSRCQAGHLVVLARWAPSNGSRRGPSQCSSNEGAIAAAVANLEIVSTALWGCRAELESGALVRVLGDWEMESVEVNAVFPLVGRRNLPHGRL